MSNQPNNFDHFDTHLHSDELIPDGYEDSFDDFDDDLYGDYIEDGDWDVDWDEFSVQDDDWSDE